MAPGCAAGRAERGDVFPTDRGDRNAGGVVLAREIGPGAESCSVTGNLLCL